MPRLRGPEIVAPVDGKSWPILNHLIYGSNQRGGHHTKPLERETPWSWTEIFGREAPLLLEVGFNRGKFIRELALQRPDANIVGIEIRKRFGWRLSQLMEDADGPQNLRIIWGDAKILLPAIFTPESVDELFVTFPDPWWKKRHEKRRLVDTDFAREIASQLSLGGKVWVKSDVGLIANEIKEALIARPEFSSPVKFEKDTLPLTHRETNCVRMGLPIHRFKLTKVKAFDSSFVPEKTKD